jgi:hypothetical protein
MSTLADAINAALNIFVMEVFPSTGRSAESSYTTPCDLRSISDL